MNFISKFVLGIIFFFGFFEANSQSFYFIDDEMQAVVRSFYHPKMPSNWMDLTIDEAEELLEKQGYDKERISRELDGDLEIVQSVILANKSGKAFAVRYLEFLDGVIVSYRNETTSIVSQRRYKNERRLDRTSEIAREYIQKEINRDKKVEDMFLENYEGICNEKGFILTQITGDLDQHSITFPAANNGRDLLVFDGAYSAIWFRTDTLVFNGFQEWRTGRMESDVRTHGDWPQYDFEVIESYQVIPRSYMVGDIDLKQVDTYDLPKMINVFILDCWKHQIELPDDIVSTIQSKFVSLEPGTLALSYGMHNAREINVVVDPKNWPTASEPSKWYVMYHELGHDVLNLEHGDCGKMMFPFADEGYSWNEFWEDKESMFQSFTERNK